MWLSSSWLLIVNWEKIKTYFKVALLNKKEAQLKGLENYQLTHIAKNGNTKDVAKWSFDKDISIELTISTEARDWKNVAEEVIRAATPYPGPECMDPGNMAASI